METNETWMPVRGYEGRYEVSDLGRVRSLNYKHTGEIEFIKTTTIKGYELAHLFDGMKTKNRYVHRLVWEAFKKPIPVEHQIDHINGLKWDNRLVNLRCVTPKENNNNPITRERYLTSMERHKKNILQLDKDTGEVIGRWECAADAWRETGIHKDAIATCCRGRIKSSGGYKWCYADQYEDFKKHFEPYQRKPQGKPVCQIDIVTGKILNTYPSGMEAHRQTGVNSVYISECCLGKRNSAGDYIWKFADERRS